MQRKNNSHFPKLYLTCIIQVIKVHAMSYKPAAERTGLKMVLRENQVSHFCLQKMFWVLYDVIPSGFSRGLVLPKNLIFLFLSFFFFLITEKVTINSLQLAGSFITFKDLLHKSASYIKQLSFLTILKKLKQFYE